MVRHSLNFVSRKHQKVVAAALKAICQAPTQEWAETKLDVFAAKWDATHPTIAKKILYRSASG